MDNLRNFRITLALAAVAVVSVLVLASWDFKQPAPFTGDFFQPVADTVPKKDSREKKIRDLDDVLDELNQAELQVNMEKIQKELAEAMKKIDAAKIRTEVENALKEVDVEKIKKEIESSLAKIDWDKMKAELERVKEIDMEKLGLDMKKMEDELSRIGPEIEKSLEKAKVEIEKAKEEMKEYNEFVNDLEKDGLLNRKQGYSIKHKDRELFINGKKASDATYNKYRSFLDKHKKITIEKTDDDFDINVD
jgi:Na+/phosphate symporter